MTATAWRIFAPIMAGLAFAAVPLASATASASLTPDQRFVSELKGARQAGQLAFRQLTPWSISLDKVKGARSELTKARDHLKKASLLAPDAVGASGADIAGNVRSATTLSAQAASYVRKGNYGAARESIDAAIDANENALSIFGVPLAKEFQAFAVYRELGNIEGWEEYLGLTAKVGAPIKKVVVGIAGRETANAAEPGGRRAPPSLPITKLAIYTLQEPSGAYSSGWGKIVNGIIVCDLNPTMKADEKFAVSFGPRVPKGTKFLVKFWATDGRRSYSVLTTR